MNPREGGGGGGVVNPRGGGGGGLLYMLCWIYFVLEQNEDFFDLFIENSRMQ